MRKFFAIVLVSIFLKSCNDGDIIVTSFNFEELPLNNCGGPGNYVFFIINGDTRESISLKLSTQDSIFNTQETLNFTLDGISNFVNYRTYDDEITAAYFCNSVPPLSPNVNVEYFGASGIATIDKNFIFNDNDNVPTELEFDGDTDGDGLPDLYDFDDDGDNVPTGQELDILDEDGDGDPFTNPKDTDGDGTPDYLDEDDDGDGVLTRNEDANGDLNPTNDATDPEVGPDYLNPAIAVNNLITEYREHTYSIQIDVQVILSNLVLTNDEEQITQETLDMGIKQNIQSVNVTVTPILD